eukprot:6175261-Pleurochrysis_carterae.AAC.4
MQSMCADGDYFTGCSRRESQESSDGSRSKRASAARVTKGAFCMLVLNLLQTEVQGGDCAGWCNKWTCAMAFCADCGAKTDCPEIVLPEIIVESTESETPNWDTADKAVTRNTFVDILGEEFYINGEPTFKGRKWKGRTMQGLLPNSRMVNAIFDDLNEYTEHLWKYPDTGVWDADRNTNELIDALPDYAASGLKAITVNVQGGSPCGNNPADDHPPCGEMYGRDSSGYDKDGNLRAPFFDRLGRLIDACDRLGMVVFLQLFYPDEARKIFNGNNDAVLAAADNTVDWLLQSGRYSNVLLDVCNECDLCRIAYRYCPAKRLALTSLHWPSVVRDWDDVNNVPLLHNLEGTHGELLERIRERAKKQGVKLYISSSYVGGNMPEHDNVGNVDPTARELEHFDYINIHGNNLWHYKDGNLVEMVNQVRSLPTYRTMPVVITEDDGLCEHDGTMEWPIADKAMHDPANTGPQGVKCDFYFETCEPTRNSKCAFGNAVWARVSWGIFLSCCGFATCPAWSHDYNRGESFQCPPINWGWESSSTKRNFFTTLLEATG